MTIDEQIQAMVLEAIPVPKSCAFEKMRADYKRSILVQKIKELLVTFGNKSVQHERSEERRVGKECRL